MARALVVVGEALARRRRARTGPPGTVDPAVRRRPTGPRAAARPAAAGRRGASPGASSRCAGARGAATSSCRTGSTPSRADDGERALAHVGEVARARRRRRAARSRRAPRAASRRRRSVAARSGCSSGSPPRRWHEPEVLVGGDVREVPDQRAHERVDLALELGVRQVRDERERPLAGVPQGLLRVGHRVVHHTPGLQHHSLGGDSPPSRPRRAPPWRTDARRVALLPVHEAPASIPTSSVGVC